VEASGNKIEIVTPVIRLEEKQIIRPEWSLRAAAIDMSCYQGEDLACEPVTVACCVACVCRGRVPHPILTARVPRGPDDVVDLGFPAI